MKSNFFLISKILILTLLILGQGCSSLTPEIKNLPPESSALINYSDKLQDKITIEDLSCRAKTKCSPQKYCSTSQFNDLIKADFVLDHKLPTDASIRIERDGFLVYFQWEQPIATTPQTNTVAIFSKGTAWIFKILMREKDFGNIRDPFVHYTDFITNLPCAFKHTKYARNMGKSEFEDKLHSQCTLSKKQIQKQRLYEIKRLHERYMIRYGHSFNVGSTCPEKIKVGHRYFILFRYHPSIRAETNVSISSLLTESTFNLELRPTPAEQNKQSNYPHVRDCPYLISDSDMLIHNNRYSCGKYDDKSWINNLRVPIKRHDFIPGKYVSFAHHQ